MAVPERIPFVALLLAAGSSSRLGGDTPKQFLALRGRTILEWSAVRLARVPGHVATVLAVDSTSVATRVVAMSNELERAMVVATLEGGLTRQESCRRAFNAAAALDEAWSVVAVHDCARPFFSVADTERAVRLAHERGGAILGHGARDTLKRVKGDGRIDGTIDRDSVFQAATPQVFRRDCFERMLAFADQEGITGTDEAGLAEACGVEVHAVESSSTNLKITYESDLQLARGLEKLLEDE
ncbi:MAG: IspD/TarI family cytidylyltransferase [Planctomycetota bacterium]|jgi:2-C-methyl-D-erythritol 4-phosphate cytidylyltransferase|nr:IspD/TarI family cytidylyltransferase [Planctomycetota bacterium]